RDGGYRVLEADALAALAATDLATNTIHQAIDHARAALDIHQQTGYRLGQANTHLLLGHALHAAGQRDRAHHHVQRAHAIRTDVGAPSCTAAPDNSHAPTG